MLGDVPSIIILSKVQCASSRKASHQRTESVDEGASAECFVINIERQRATGLGKREYELLNTSSSCAAQIP